MFGQNLAEPMPNFWGKVFQPVVNDQLILETLRRLNRLGITAQTQYDYSATVDQEDPSVESKSMLKLKRLIKKLNPIEKNK